MQDIQTENPIPAVNSEQIRFVTMQITSGNEAMILHENVTGDTITVSFPDSHNTLNFIISADGRECKVFYTRIKKLNMLNIFRNINELILVNDPNLQFKRRVLPAFKICKSFKCELTPGTGPVSFVFTPNGLFIQSFSKIPLIISYFGR